MIRLRSFAASARQVRVRSFAASARQIRVRSFAASARQVRVRSFAASARHGRPLTRFALSTATLVMIFGGSSVFACPMCFGAEESSMIDGAKLGVFVLLGITLAVQGGFVGFFLYLRKRAKHVADVELDTEWSELQRGSRTS